MTSFVTRKRLEIFIEAHALERLEVELASAGFKGWSVFRGVEGAGTHGSWRQTGVGESEAYMVIAIGSEDATEQALAWLTRYFSEFPGIVAASDVSVMRGDRF